MRRLSENKQRQAREIVAVDSGERQGEPVDAWGGCFQAGYGAKLPPWQSILRTTRMSSGMVHCEEILDPERDYLDTWTGFERPTGLSQRRAPVGGFGLGLIPLPRGAPPPMAGAEGRDGRPPPGTGNDRLGWMGRPPPGGEDWPGT
jgi:hypothetical protein